MKKKPHPQPQAPLIPQRGRSPSDKNYLLNDKKAFVFLCALESLWLKKINNKKVKIRNKEVAILSKKFA